MNTISAAWMIARKDLKLFFRDRTGMALGFLLPAVLIAVFGFVMKFAFGGGSGGMPRATLWVADEDGTDASRAFVEDLRETDVLRVRPRTDEDSKSEAQVRKQIEDGDAHHALIIEAGFSEALAAAKLPELTMIRDPGRTMEAQVIQVGLMQAFMQTTEGKLWPASMGRIMREMGMAEPQVQALVAASQTMQQVIGNYVASLDEKDSAAAKISSSGEGAADADGGADGKKQAFFDFMRFFEDMVPVDNEDVVPPGRPRMVTYQLAQAVSGVTVMMLLFGMLACGAMLLQEREGGTLQRLLVASVPRGSILWAKFIFAAIVGMLQLLVLFLVGNVLFRIEAFRDPVTLLVLSVSWAAAATSFGMLIAAWAQTTKQAEGVATLLILLMAALGGCWFPVQMLDMPRFAEIITQSTLTYWAMSGYQGMFWEQWSWTHPNMLTAIGVQWAFAVVASAFALWLFKRRYIAG